LASEGETLSGSDMLDPRRKRLLHRATHCGMQENDILIGRFAAAHVGELTDEQVERFETLLDQNDVDLFNWIIGREAPPPEHDHDVMKLIKNFNKNVH
jgi:antitoxin CptB